MAQRPPSKSKPVIFYFVTTGSPGTVNPFGRLYRLTFDPSDPVAGAATLTILLDGSEGIVSPDNIDTNKHGEIVICEDPNYNLATDLGLTRDTSLWVYDMHTGSLTRIAELDRPAAYAHAIAADAGNSGSTIGTPGGWEFSGVIDAEPWLGRGSWIIDVQAHTLRIAPLPRRSRAARFCSSCGSRAISNVRRSLIYCREIGPSHAQLPRALER